jgi:hypothetical protein
MANNGDVHKNASMLLSPGYNSHNYEGLELIKNKSSIIRRPPMINADLDYEANSGEVNNISNQNPSEEY